MAKIISRKGPQTSKASRHLGGTGRRFPGTDHKGKTQEDLDDDDEEDLDDDEDWEDEDDDEEDLDDDEDWEDEDDDSDPDDEDWEEDE